MAVPILYLGALAVSAILTGTWLNTQAVESKENPLEPKIFGQDARNVAMGAGTVGAFFLGGPIGAAFAGAAIAGYLNKDATNKFSAALDDFAKHQQLSRPADGPLALPSPPPAPGAHGVHGAEDGGGWLSGMLEPEYAAAA